MHLYALHEYKHPANNISTHFLPLILKICTGACYPNSMVLVYMYVNKTVNINYASYKCVRVCEQGRSLCSIITMVFVHVHVHLHLLVAGSTDQLVQIDLDLVCICGYRCS